MMNKLDFLPHKISHFSFKGLFYQYFSIISHYSLLMLCLKIDCLFFYSDCKFNCHKKCAEHVPKDCTGELPKIGGMLKT